MAKKYKSITETGPKPLRGIRNPDLYDNSDIQFSDEDKERLSRIHSDATYSNYAARTGNIGMDAFLEEGITSTGINESLENFGKSSYDDGMGLNLTPEDVSEIRGIRQSGIAQIGSGLGKMITTAGTTFLNNTVGLVWGAISAGVNNQFSKLYDNSFTNAMEDFSEAMEELMPNYYTKDEQEHVLSNLISTNFLGDKLIKNLGFVIGTVYSGNLWSSTLRSLGGAAAGVLAKGARAAAHSASQAGKMNTAKNFLSAGTTAMKALKVGNNVVTPALATLTGAIGESSLEALQVVRDFRKQHGDRLEEELKFREKNINDAYERGEINDYTYASLLEHAHKAYNDSKKKLEEDAVSAGNLTFAINLPTVWGANFLMFGKLFSRGFSTAKKLARTENKNVIRKSADNILDGYNTNFTKLGKYWDLYKGPLGEGSQEWAQEFASSLSKNAYGTDVENYYKAAFDGESYAGIQDWSSQIYSSFKDNFNENSTEAFLLGALTSLMGVPNIHVTKNSEGKYVLKFSIDENIISKTKEYNKNKAKTIEVVNKLNARLQDPKYVSFWKSLARHKALNDELRVHAEIGDKLEYENTLTTQLNSDLDLFSSIGRIGDLVEYVQSFGELTKEEAEELIYNDTQVDEVSQENKELRASISTEIDDLTKRLQPLQDKRDSIASEIYEETQKANPSSEFINAKQSQLNSINSRISQLEEGLEIDKKRLSSIPEKDVYFGQFVDKDGNIDDYETIKKKVNDNKTKLLSYIENYEMTREEINLRTDNKLSSDALGFLTNMYMSIIDRKDRIESMMRDTISKNFETALESMKAEHEALEFSAEFLSPSEKKHMEALKSQIDFIEDLLKNGKSYARIASRLGGVREQLDIIEDVIDNISNISPIQKEETKRALRDTIKLNDSINDIESTLDGYLKNPEKVAKKFDEDIDSVTRKDKKKREKNLSEKLRNVTNMEEFNAATEGQRSDEIEKILNDNKDNEFLNRKKERDKVLEVASKAIVESEELTDAEKYQALHAMKAAEDPDRELSAQDLIKREKALKAAKSAEEAENEIAKQEKLASKVQAIIDKSVAEATEAMEAADKIPPMARGTGASPAIAGKDGSPEVPSTKPSKEKEDDGTPIVDYNTYKRQSKNVHDVDENTRLRALAPSTREVLNNYGEDFDKAVDKLPYSDKVKKKIKAVHKYLLDHNAFSYINSGKVERGSEVHFMIDPVLNKDAGTVVILLTDATGQVIGDLPALDIENDYINTVPGLKSMLTLINNEWEKHTDKNKPMTSSYTTTVNSTYVGKPAYTEGTNISVNEFWESGEELVFGVVGKDGSLTHMESETMLVPPVLISKEHNGKTVLFLPSGNTTRSGKFVAYPAICHYDTYSIQDAAINDGAGLFPVIDELIKSILNITVTDDGISVSELKNIFKELNKYIYFEYELTGKGKNLKLTVTNHSTRKSSIPIYDLIISKDKSTTETILKKTFEGSYFQVTKNLFGSTLPNGTPYNEAVAYHLSVDIAKGVNHTVGDWFSINPINSEGSIVKTSRFNSASEPNPTKSGNMYKVTIGDKSYNVDLDTGNIFLPPGTSIDEKTKDRVLTEAYLQKVFGDKQNAAGLIDNVAKLADGRWYDRNKHEFVEDPTKATQREKDRVAKVKLAEDTAKSIQERNIKLTTSERFYKDEDNKLHIRVTESIKADKKSTDDEFDENHPFYTPSTVIGNTFDAFIRDYFDKDFTLFNDIDGNINELIKRYKNLNKEEIVKLVKQLEVVRKKLNKMKLKVVPKGITLNGKLKFKDGNKTVEIDVAGTVDLLCIDEKGNYHIIDVKTHHGEITEYTKRKWNRQVTIYKILEEQTYGIPVKGLMILPIHVPYADPIGYTNNKTKEEGKAKYENKKGELWKDGKKIDEIPFTVGDLIKFDEPYQLNLQLNKISETLKLMKKEQAKLDKEQRKPSQEKPEPEHKEEEKKPEEKPKEKKNGPPPFLSNLEKMANNEEAPNTPKPKRTPRQKLNSRVRAAKKFNDEDDELFRVVTGDSEEVWDSDVEKEWLKKTFPNLNTDEVLSIKKAFIITSRGKVHGRFVRSVMEIYEKAAKGTLFHESFHMVSQTLLSDEEQENMYNLAKKEFGNIGFTALEEALAEGFRKYTMSIEYSGKFAQFFKKLWNIVRTLGGKRNTINSLYYRINRGDYSERMQREDETYAKKLKNQETALIADLEDFFSNFGISLNELNQWTGTEPIFSALDRVINYKNIKDLTDNCGYAIAFMTQYNPYIHEIVVNKYIKDVASPGMREILKQQMIKDGRMSDKEYEGINKQEYLKAIGKDIARELRKRYRLETTEHTPYLERVWGAIREFFRNFNNEKRARYNVIQGYYKSIANKVKLGDYSFIIHEKSKPGTTEIYERIDLAKVLEENPKDEKIISLMTKHGIALAGSASIAANGIIFRPSSNFLHDLDFNVFNKTKEEVEQILDKTGYFFKHEYHINGSDYQTESYIIIDREFDEVRSTSNEGDEWLIYDKKTGELIGSRTSSNLNLKEGVNGRYMDFFLQSTENDSVMMSFNNKPYLISNYKRAMKFKVEQARRKDVFDYSRFLEDSNTKEAKDRKLKYSSIQRARNILKSSKIVWGHPAIGKTTYLETRKDIIEWDEEVNSKRNRFIRSQIDPRGKMSEKDWKIKKSQYLAEWRTHPEYIKFITNEWNRLKDKAEREHKQIYASPMILLELFKDDFDAVVAIPYDMFTRNNIQRGGKMYSTEEWKQNIDNILVNIPESKLIYTDKYFTDFMDIVFKDEEEDYRRIEQYHREQRLHQNLSREDKQLVKELGFTEEEWQELPDQIKEIKLHCRN